MTIVFVAFLAGILTVAAPCILPLLPVVIGSSLAQSGSQSSRKPYIVAASLGVSVVVFSLLLKATTVLLGVPTAVWQIISGIIISIFGLQLVWPSLWEHLNTHLGLQSITGGWLSGASSQSRGPWGDVLLGAALGPVFNSCSPTYALLVATILPVSFWLGFIALIAYALGLCGTLLAISLLGQRVIGPLRGLSNPTGWFRRILGILLVVTGLAIIFGLDKALQTYVLEQGWYDAIGGLEKLIIDRFGS